MAVQMAAAVGVDLHGLGARGRHAAGIVVGLQVAFDDGHAELAGQVMQGAFQQGRLAGARRRDQVQGQDLALAQLLAHAGRDLLIGFQNVAHHRNLHRFLPELRPFPQGPPGGSMAAGRGFMNPGPR